jgi:hypothetical protein
MYVDQEREKATDDSSRIEDGPENGNEPGDTIA